MRSIRFRYTLMYSGVLFGLAALVVAALYLILSLTLRRDQLGTAQTFCNEFTGRCVDVFTMGQFEALVHAHTLDKLRTLSFEALVVLFFASFAVGWVIAGRVLAPIGRITAVARDIQATDLSRRIRLPGPEDELKQLADTFDAMLARLEAAFSAQQRFIADASHELRNPLAIIRTNIDVALSDPDADPEELRQAIVVVRRASERMARLVDDLLALARREMPTFQREPVDLGQAIGEASEEFVVPARARGIVLDRAIAGYPSEGSHPADPKPAGRSRGLAPEAPESPRVVVIGDRDALKRAVANLLDNAVRLAPEGSRIRLAVGSERGQAWVAVSDEGPGIAPEDQQHVFDRFWRADKARSRADGGAGLGLAIVRQIVQSHGGEVQLQSRLGVGSTFTIWLPVADLAGGQAPRATSVTSR
jgi:signal transduction histidine kinase